MQYDGGYSDSVDQRGRPTVTVIFAHVVCLQISQKTFQMRILASGTVGHKNTLAENKIHATTDAMREYNDNGCDLVGNLQGF